MNDNPLAEALERVAARHHQALAGVRPPNALASRVRRRRTVTTAAGLTGAGAAAVALTLGTLDVVSHVTSPMGASPSTSASTQPSTNATASFGTATLDTLRPPRPASPVDGLTCVSPVPTPVPTMDGVSMTATLSNAGGPINALPWNDPKGSSSPSAFGTLTLHSDLGKETTANLSEVVVVLARDGVVAAIFNGPTVSLQNGTTIDGQAVSNDIAAGPLLPVYHPADVRAVGGGANEKTGVWEATVNECAVVTTGQLSVPPGDYQAYVLVHAVANGDAAAIRELRDPKYLDQLEAIHARSQNGDTVESKLDVRYPTAFLGEQFDVTLVSEPIPVRVDQLFVIYTAPSGTP